MIPSWKININEDLDVRFNNQKVILNHSKEHDLIKRVVDRTDYSNKEISKIITKGLEEVFKTNTFSKKEDGYCIYFYKSKFILSFSWNNNSYYIHTILPWSASTNKCKKLIVNEEDMKVLIELLENNLVHESFEIKETDEEWIFELDMKCSKCLEVEL